MPTEQSDNTRVTSRVKLPTRKNYKVDPGTIYDTNKAKRALNLLNFYNTNFFGAGVFGNQTNIDPTTPEGLKAIESNYNYSKENMAILTELLGLSALLEGFNFLVTPVKIGSGSESIVMASPISNNVIKETTKKLRDILIENKVPTMVKQVPIKGTKNGNLIKLRKVIPITDSVEEAKAIKELDKRMLQAGWQRIHHPNLYGPAYTNGKYVVSDIVGNIGKTRILRKPRLYDSVVETPYEFLLAMEKKGGKLLHKPKYLK